MSETYSQGPHCHYKPAVPLPISEPSPACGIYTFKWGQHRSGPSNKPVTGPSLRTRWAAADPIVRIKIGSMLAFLGGWVSVPSLASGTITLTRNGNVISRANAPLEFWFLVLSALAVAVFGAWVAIAGLINDRADSDVAALGITGDKMLLYLVLFCVLAVIYSIYLEGVIEGRREAELRDPAWPF